MKFSDGARAGLAIKMILQAAIDTSLPTSATRSTRSLITPWLSGLHTSAGQRTKRTLAFGTMASFEAGQLGSSTIHNSNLVKSMREQTRMRQMRSTIKTGRSSSTTQVMTLQPTLPSSSSLTTMAATTPRITPTESSSTGATPPQTTSMRRFTRTTKVCGFAMPTR